MTTSRAAALTPRIAKTIVILPLLCTVALAIGPTAAGASKAPSTASQLKQLKTLNSHAKSGTGSTFKAVYTYSNNGTSGTVTLEQKPPKTLFTSNGTTVIANGSGSYICSNQGGKETCINEGAISNPLVGLETLFSPADAEAFYSQAQAYIAAKISGYHISFSSKTIGGQGSSCVTVTGKGTNAKYCESSKSGIITYEGANGGTFQLKSYSSNVSANDFNLPAGATVETIPSIP
jgi:hypothetical protein